MKMMTPQAGKKRIRPEAGKDANGSGSLAGTKINHHTKASQTQWSSSTRPRYGQLHHQLPQWAPPPSMPLLHSRLATAPQLSTQPLATTATKYPHMTQQPFPLVYSLSSAPAHTESSTVSAPVAIPLAAPHVMPSYEAFYHAGEDVCTAKMENISRKPVVADVCLQTSTDFDVERSQHPSEPTNLVMQVSSQYAHMFTVHYISMLLPCKAISVFLSPF